MVYFPFNYKATLLIGVLPKHFQKEQVAFFTNMTHIRQGVHFFYIELLLVKVKHPHPSLGFDAIERSLKPKKCQKWSISLAQTHKFLKDFTVLLMDEEFMTHGVEPTFERGNSMRVTWLHVIA